MYAHFEQCRQLVHIFHTAKYHSQIQYCISNNNVKVLASLVPRPLLSLFY